MPIAPTPQTTTSHVTQEPVAVPPSDRSITPASRARQVLALARGEAIQLFRNKVALLNCFALPLVTAALFVGMVPGDAPLGALVPTVVIGTAILFVVYYTLVTALVARRESLLLKRLRTGECSDAVILGGIALPFVVVTLVQAIVATGAAVAVFDVAVGPGLLLVLLAALLGTLTFTALALASTPMTKTVEHAQITTLPVILVPIMLSGLTVPLALMPEAMRAVAQVMPLTPVIELIHLGVTGTDIHGQALAAGALLVATIRPVLVLLGWTAAAAWVGARTMRWEPRS